MRVFTNTTGTGNVAAMIVEVSDCPRSMAGKAHAQLRARLSNGTETAKAGNYHPTREAAESQAQGWLDTLTADARFQEEVG
jgi:hypothetical protein